LKSNHLRKAGVRADLPLELLAERRRGHGREQSDANNRPAAALLFEQRDPTMAKQSLQRSGERLAESAEEIKLSTYEVEDSAERTTQLAADRTVFAAERTYAAWVRTGLLAMASGIGAKALLSGLISEWLIVVTGSVLVLFSAFCFGAAVWRHLEPGVPPPPIDVSRIPPWVLIAVNGFLALVALAALVGIWFGRPPSVSS
jgi:putative membrane protein